MSSDESAAARGQSQRQVERILLPAGPLRDLSNLLYRLYLEASTPTLKAIAEMIAGDNHLAGSPNKDVVGGLLNGMGLPGRQADVVAVATVLARRAAWDATDVAARTRDLWMTAELAPPPAFVGKPIRDCSPTALEVHPAIDLPEHADQGLPKLPVYVPRAHDTRLRKIVQEAVGGTSRISILVGGSSTGKSRACWEAIQSLPAQWRVWHPIDPSRPDAVAADLGKVGSYTVVWLNEAQHYLLPPGKPDLGEQVAAALRTLLADPTRGPVLVLSTIWQRYWDTLTTRPALAKPDLYGQARELLAGSDLTVPDAFTTPDERDGLREAAGQDPRLRHAIEHAQDGRITQHLAGTPELLRRYRNAPPPARAVIHAAIDARRLGHPQAIPHVFLEHAAPGYLTDYEWEQAEQDWLEQALAYAGTPCHGTPGPLTLMRPRPNESLQTEPRHRLADYLEQIGCSEFVTLNWPHPDGLVWPHLVA